MVFTLRLCPDLRSRRVRLVTVFLELEAMFAPPCCQNNPNKANLINDLEGKVNMKTKNPLILTLLDCETKTAVV